MLGGFEASVMQGGESRAIWVGLTPDTLIAMRHWKKAGGFCCRRLA